MLENNIADSMRSKRPNKSPAGGVQVVVRLEGISREDEAGVLSADEVSGGASKVRNLTCGRDNDYSGRQHTKKIQLVRLSHAREFLSRAIRATCGVPCTPPGESPFPVSETP